MHSPELIAFAEQIAEDADRRLVIDTVEPCFGFKDPDGFHPPYWASTEEVERERRKRR